jgi:hypothetical protein
MCLFVFIYASANSWDGLGQKNWVKKIFLMRQWRFESVPEMSLPPFIFEPMVLTEFFRRYYRIIYLMFRFLLVCILPQRSFISSEYCNITIINYCVCCFILTYSEGSLTCVWHLIHKYCIVPSSMGATVHKLGRKYQPLVNGSPVYKICWTERRKVCYI